MYPGQAGDELSAWSETREDPVPFTRDADGTLFDEAAFEIRGDELVLRYLSYPADAPVETTMRLERL